MVSCKECKREFSSKEALQMHLEHKHMSKEEAKNLRESHHKNKKIQKYFFFSIGGILLLTISYWLFSNVSTGTYSNGSERSNIKDTRM